MILALAICLLGGPLRLEAKWTAPKDLPFPRVHAIERSAGSYFVGGLRGLAIQKDGKWKTLDDRPVRDMASSEGSVWVLFGDGSVDKIEPKADRLVYDVMAKAAKRPWVSCLASCPSGLLFGGNGGWIERSETQTESYPEVLKGQVVTAIFRDGATLWIGTQRSGLYRISSKKVDRFGFAAGLPDSWVTCMAKQGDRLIIGFAEGGAGCISEGRYATLDCPSAKVRKLAVFHGLLVVGGMDGAWICGPSNSFERLSDEETTALAIDGDRLAVASPTGVAWWRFS